MNPPQPGAHPPIVPRHREVPRGELQEWYEYQVRSNRFWQAATTELMKVVPAVGREYIGGGDVIRVVYEDRSYAWLGGDEHHEGDAPYADGQCNWAGGYRYAPDCDGEVMTDSVWVEVEEPRELDDVVRALAEVARQLGRLPFTQTV